MSFLKQIYGHNKPFCYHPCQQYMLDDGEAIFSTYASHYIKIYFFLSKKKTTKHIYSQVYMLCMAMIHFCLYSRHRERIKHTHCSR